MFCAYTRPRYQVSVYRTINPLVFSFPFFFLFFFVLFENIEFNEAVLTFTHPNNFFRNIDRGYSLYKLGGFNVYPQFLV